MYTEKLISALATRLSPKPDLADAVEVQLHDVKSRHPDTEVAVSVLLPPGFTREQGLPVLISLDGGLGDRESLIRRRSLYAGMFVTGVLPPLIVVSFSGAAGQFHVGAWEDWIASELPDWVQATFGARVDAANLLLTGVSAGGHGALKVAFRQPSRFAAVAALQPAIMATLDWPEQHTRTSWWMFEASARAIYGEPFPQTFLRDHPPRLAVSRAEEIRASGLEIYLEAGDEDMVMLHDGAEFLHRLLWKHDIPHEYHLVRWADHGGPSLNDRIIESHAFLAGALAGGRRQARDLPLNAAEQAFVDYVLSGGPAMGEPPPENASQGDPDSARALSVMARLYEPMKGIAAANDPEMKRHYGRLPESG